MYNYSDHELEAWGEIFTKHRLYERRGMMFVSFMALSAPARRWHIRACEGAMSRLNNNTLREKTDDPGRN